MVTRSVIFAFALFLAATGRADLSFVPRESSYEVEGIKLSQLAFTDGSANEITYQQPPGWSFSGTSAKLTLRPPHVSQAEGTISKISSSHPVAFDEAGLKQMIKGAFAAVPEGSTDVKVVSQEQNLVKIGGKETFQVIVSYILYGIRYERSMMFMNRGNDQIIFQFVSPAANFKALQQAFLASQFNWQNL